MRVPPPGRRDEVYGGPPHPAIARHIDRPLANSVHREYGRVAETVEPRGRELQAHALYR